MPLEIFSVGFIVEERRCQRRPEPTLAGVRESVPPIVGWSRPRRIALKPIPNGSLSILLPQISLFAFISEVFEA
jgi:hypothetical protein